MCLQRFYYADTLSDFLKRNETEIIGKLAENDPHDINNETTRSWKEEIETLQPILSKYTGLGSIFFEYNIPRMGTRADVIILIDGIVFVLEFKTLNSEFSREALIQTWDYALDLKNFHEGSFNRTIVPILVCPNEKDKNCHIVLKKYQDNVYEPLMSNANQLSQCISLIINNVDKSEHIDSSKDFRWAHSGYEPTPTIIEAARSLYNNHTVEDITKHDGDVTTTSKCIIKIIEECRTEHRKAICFVTGVPGAGKTLIGLQTAIEQFKANDKAVYLSGNFPLVEVLQEALARDTIKHSKDEYNAGKTDHVITKKEAKSKVKAFIQMIHHYRDLCLEGIEVKGDKLVMIPGYFTSHKDKAYIPIEKVAIFDEAQRAWTKEAIVKFMKDKNHINNFPYSEPEFLISCMDRQLDWGLIICLIGGGQEINNGEAGITEWIESLNRSFPKWNIYMSDRLKEQEYADGKALEMIEDKNMLHIEPDLHLSVSMRSFRAEKVSLFIHQLLALEKDKASDTLKELKKYPIVLTRSLDKAKEWMRSKRRGSERMGLLASSKADRLKAISVNVRYQPDFIHWFLENDDDVRSSNALEDVLTEFKVQGLEIDWSCVMWDADLRLDTKKNKWTHHCLRNGTKWQHINKRENQLYQINAYRVLLTRARQGMVIVVPEGDMTLKDTTRNPQWYDDIYNYLNEIGLKEI